MPDAFFLVAVAALVAAIVPGPSWLAWIPAIVAIVGGVLMLALGRGERGTSINAVVISVCAWGIAVVVSLGQVAATFPESGAAGTGEIRVDIGERADGEVGESPW